jgi:hypothetical protein
MRKAKLLFIMAMACCQMWAQKTSVCSPGSLLKVDVTIDGGRPSYSVNVSSV